MSATVLLVVFLGIMGVGLNRAFERSVLASAEDALRNQILLLISAIDVVDGEVVAPAALAEPRLVQADADLFAQIYLSEEPNKNRVVWRSPSLLEETLPFESTGLGDFEFHSTVTWNEFELNTMTLAVEWETESKTVPFVVQVAESHESYRERLARYQQQVGLWLVFFGGALVVLLLGMLGWALKPLERVRRQVGEIEQGKRQRFDENYPSEVNRLTQNLNQLLSFDEQRIKHQKEVLGNLAHSLKTPIAILRGLPYGESVRQDSNEQLSVMQNIIDYQLQSASTIGRRRFAQAIEIKNDSEKMVRSLQKLYVDKGVSSTLSMADEVRFYGDLGDWMEVFGNLTENAFKWSESRVSITVRNVVPQDETSTRQALHLVVEDDGPGVAEQMRESILQRGVRLDSQTPGHGLGMHIVKGIVEAYEGEISVLDSQLYEHGAKIEIVLN